MRNFKLRSNAGNALFLIMIAIFIVGLLTKTLVEKNFDTSQFATSAKLNSQTRDIQAHAANLELSINLMLADGVNIADLSDSIPTDTDFETAPHAAKLYHPFGGGVQYYEDYNGWNDIIIHTSAVITDVGPSTAPDIIAVGSVSAEICTRLARNQTPATASNASLTALLTGTVVTLTDGSTCSAGTCNAMPEHCLTNALEDTFVYYKLLHAQ